MLLNLPTKKSVGLNDDFASTLAVPVRFEFKMHTAIVVCRWVSRFRQTGLSDLSMLME